MIHHGHLNVQAARVQQVAEEAERALAIELLDVQPHSIGDKLEKPRRPVLAKSGDAVEDTD